MLLGVLLPLVLLPVALLVAAPAIADALMWMTPGKRKNPAAPGSGGALPRLLFVIPSHDEELLIGRAVRSLRQLDYPAELFSILVVADNCSDGTAAMAASEGAEVMERRSTDLRGKGHALAWAWNEVSGRAFDAFVIIDADTIVDAHLARSLAAVPDLRNGAAQCYDDMSNERESALTRMAGVLTRNRYGIAYPLKQRAGLMVPLTGDGSVIGWDVAKRYGLNSETITEGWEFFARYTLDKVPCTYVGDARIYAQEARSLQQSGTQRARWTAGRLAVLRLYAGRILRTPGISILQRLDLLAELSSLGPVMRGAIGVVGFFLSLACPVRPVAAILAALFATAVLQPVIYSIITLIEHPEPVATLRAFMLFPAYAAWRVLPGVTSLGMSGRKSWVRTARHEE